MKSTAGFEENQEEIDSSFSGRSTLLYLRNFSLWKILLLPNETFQAVAQCYTSFL